jgi:surface carbohydrate biosynthesis protein
MAKVKKKKRKTKMKIAILTLCGQRDKCIDDMLADELRKHGHAVTVRNYINAGMETVCYEKPDVVIVPMPGGQYKYDFIKQCKEWGIEVVVRRGEAGMGRAEFANLSPDRKTIIVGHWDYSPYVDLELVWGQEFADILFENGNMPAYKIKACGAFAFDPYIKSGVIRNSERKTILFATGFSTADCRSEYCECGLPEESAYHEQIYDLHCEARQAWIEAITVLFIKHGDEWNIELKVRPGELITEYRDRIPSGVKIHEPSKPSLEALQNVDILVHSGSTMAIEAHLMGMPSFNYCNVNPDPLLAAVSPRPVDYEALELSLEEADIYESNIIEWAFDELIEHLYGKIDGDACFRAATFIQDRIEKINIVTEIPNSWPKDPKYLKEGVHTEQCAGTIGWLCPCCRNQYYVDNGVGIANCPYCSMPIEITKSKEPQSVLK